MNRTLLKEAIADAKTVKDTAIANAKAALEEAFTPYLKEKLAAKLAEMDDMDEAEAEPVAEEKEMDENFDMDESTGVEEINISDEMEEGKDMEEMDLDELLRELEGMEEGEKEEMTEGEEDLINNPKLPTSHGNVAEEEDMEMGEEDEEMDLENMTEEDLKSFIESVIADMVTAGELEGEIDNEGGEEIDDEEEVNIDELLSELMTERKKYGGNKGDVPSKKRGDKKSTAEEEGVEDYKKKAKKVEEQLSEALSTIKTIQTELNEVNLLNAKLLYTNKIFKSRNLSESQKVKVLEAFDKASTVKEVKLVFETLSNSSKEKKSSINESMFGGASKSAGSSPIVGKPILEVNDQFSRWQTLAGIKK
jgi:hypothetical protein